MSRFLSICFSWTALALAAAGMTGCATGAPRPAGAIVGDGTFRVGTDVEPGTYRSEGDRGETCVWSRQSEIDGVDVFDNRPGAPQTVELPPGDESFQTSHCQDWHRVR